MFSILLLECETIKYDVSSTVLQYPNKRKADDLANNEKIKGLFPENWKWN